MSTATLERASQAKVAARKRVPLREPNSSQPTGAGTAAVAQRSFEVHERWEGRVEDVCGTYFLATIENLTTGQRASTRIMSALVSPGDISLLTAGSLFFWHIGIRTAPTGEREQVSTLRFRRGLRRTTLSDEAINYWLIPEPAGDE